MPRFVSRPGVVIEACQYTGGMIPSEVAGGVLQRRADGGLDIQGADGPVRCKLTDWIIRDRDGQYSVMRDAAFEVMFERPVERPVTVTVEPERAKRPYNRRIPENV